MIKNNNMLVKNLESINLFFKPYDLIRTEIRNNIYLLNSNNERNMVSNNFKSFYRIPNNVYGKFTGFFLDLRKSYNYIIDCGLKSDLLISKTLYLRNYIDKRLLFKFEKEVMVFNDNFTFNYNNLDYIKNPYIMLRKEMQDRLAEKTVDLNEFGLGNDNIFYNDNFCRAFYVRVYDYNFSSPLLDYKNKAFFYYKFLKGDYTNLISQNSFHKKTNLCLISEQANIQIANKLKSAFFLYYTYLLKQAFCLNLRINPICRQYINNISNFNSKFIINTNTWIFATIKKLYIRNSYFLYENELNNIKLVLMERRSNLINQLLQKRLKYKIFQKLKKKLRLHLLSFYRISTSSILDYNSVFSRCKIISNSKQVFNLFYLNLWGMYKMRSKYNSRTNLFKKIFVNAFRETSLLANYYYYNRIDNKQVGFNYNFASFFMKNKRISLNSKALIKKSNNIISNKLSLNRFTFNNNNRIIKQIKKKNFLSLTFPMVNISKFVNNILIGLSERDTIFYKKFLKIDRAVLKADKIQKKLANKEPTKKIIPEKKLQLIVLKKKLTQFCIKKKFLPKRMAFRFIKKFSLNYYYPLLFSLKLPPEKLLLVKKNDKFKPYLLSINHNLCLQAFSRDRFFYYWINGVLNDFYLKTNVKIVKNNRFVDLSFLSKRVSVKICESIKNEQELLYIFNFGQSNSYDKTLYLFNFVLNNLEEYKLKKNNLTNASVHNIITTFRAINNNHKIFSSSFLSVETIFFRLIKKIFLAHLIKSRLFNFLLRFNLDIIQFTNFSLTFFKRLKYLLKFVYKFSFYFNLFNFITTECKSFYFKLIQLGDNNTLQLGMKKEFLCINFCSLIRGKQILKQLILQIKMYLSKSFLLNSFLHQINSSVRMESCTLLNASYLSLNVETFSDLYLSNLKYSNNKSINKILHSETTNYFTSFSEKFNQRGVYSKMGYFLPLITYYKMCSFKKRFVKYYSQNGFFKYNIYTVFILCYLKF
jgi:hypothetical protein